MTDSFALLDEPRRPWLDPEALKRKLLALSAECHPDRVHNQDEASRRAAHERYTQIQAAYGRLRDPRQRLLHLLELETGARPAELQQIPRSLSDMFMEIGGLCREVDTFLIEKARAISPMLKVNIFERGHEWIERLKQVQEKVGARREELLAQLKTLNERWHSDAASNSATRPTALKQLEELARLLSYFGRWDDQLQERITKLSF